MIANRKPLKQNKKEIAGVGKWHEHSESGTYQFPVDIQKVDIDRSGHWLAAGWSDFLKAPRISLIYGGAFWILSFLLSYGMVAAGLGSMVLPLAGGFVIVAPILVVGLYDVSRRLEQGGEISLRNCLFAFRDNIGQLSRWAWCS